ncbi:MAG: ATP-binding cassette domain-containing protein [Spirochaetes bacterium]|nr:ATP-binding cassette domain-containing protein [Spirochaetota bacterium]
MKKQNIVLKVENLNFNYTPGSSYILSDVSLEIYKGEFIIIVGPRGEGKSTFLKIISGLILPEEGNVFYDGVNLKGIFKKELMEIHQRTGFVFQDSALISNMNVFNNLALPLRYHEIMPEEKITEEVNKMITIINMENHRFHLPAFLSMGQRKMVALARALITQPETIFYDEPIANLDDNSRNIIVKLMTEAYNKGVTSVVITHEIDKFLGFADRIIEIKDRTIANIKNLKIDRSPETIDQKR